MVIANDGRPDNKTKRRNVAVQHNKNIPKHSNIKHIQKKNYNSISNDNNSNSGNNNNIINNINNGT